MTLIQRFGSALTNAPGAVLNSGKFIGYKDMVLLVLALAANVLICALADFLARRHACASGTSGEMDPSD